MHLPRQSGLLLHVTSLPGPYGLGDLGPAAHRFVETLSTAGQRVWQVLPLVPPGYGQSPYSSPSTFALSPLLISPERLLADGLLADDDLAGVPDFDADRVDWDAVLPFRKGLLERAFERFCADADSPWHARVMAFAGTHGATWLDDYSLFAALADAHGGAVWQSWAEPLRRRDPDALADARREHARGVAFHTFVQAVAQAHWDALHAHARAHGVSIVGDLPIYVADNSADVWANQALFKLDAGGYPTVISGVPPDDFTVEGQRWGNPLYWWHQPPFADWLPPHELRGVYERAPIHVAQDASYVWAASDAVQHGIATAPLNAHALDWWEARMRRILALVDVVRLDHFRAFAAYWETPVSAPSAKAGYWMPGPGLPFFVALRERLGDLPVIAEDLGIITPDVRRMMAEAGFSGMRVLQFGYPDNEHHPARYASDLVAYSGTHDTDTLAGWLSDGERAASAHAAMQDVGAGPHDIHPFLARLMASAAGLVVIPVQDLLGMDSDARMNVPGQSAGQWGWRLREDAISGDTLAWLRGVTQETHRL